MKLHRFIGEFDLSKKEIEIIDSKIIKQVRNVLRLKKDEKIILSDGQGQEVEVVLDSFSTNKITGTVHKIRPTIAGGSGEAKKVNLYLAILKKENFELAVQKAVECGVSSITPIITERTIKTGLNIPRLEKIILEASEQSGRNTVPILFPILNFKDALKESKKIPTSERVGTPTASVGIIFHPRSKSLSNYGGNASVSIFVGPEGGFTEKEIELAKNSGFTVASLGSFTLRGETAAIVGTYLAVHRT